MLKLGLTKNIYWLALFLAFSLTKTENQVENDQHYENYSGSGSGIESMDNGNVYCDDANELAKKDGTKVDPLDIILTIFYGVITTVGLIANGFVFFVVFSRGEIGRTITAIYVVQLALADTIFLLSLPIFGIQQVKHDWVFGEELCTVTQAIKYFNYYAGIFFLTAMSVDRYVAVAYSTKAHKLRTKTRTILACTVAWLAAGLMTLPVVMNTITVNEDGMFKCKIHFNKTMNEQIEPEYAYEDEMFGSAESGNNASPSEEEDGDVRNEESFLICSTRTRSTYNTWIIINFILGFLVPFFIITVSYLLILTHVYESEEKLSSVKGNPNSAMRKRVTRMVAVLVLCFVVCWLPYQIFILLRIEGIYVTPLVCSTLEDFLATLGFLNSALNPILYTFLGQNFKERLRDSVRKTRINLFGRNFRANKIYNRSSCSEKKECRKLHGSRSSCKYGRGSCSDAPKSSHKPISQADQASVLLSRKRVDIIRPHYSIQENGKIEIRRTNDTEFTRITPPTSSSEKL